MKKILVLAIAIILTLSIKAQENIKYEKIIAADSLSKDQIFSKIDVWLATNYQSSKDAIQTKDKESGIIIVKGAYKYSYGDNMHSPWNGYINYTISLTIKDGKFKVVLENFSHETTETADFPTSMGILTSKEVYKEKGWKKQYYNECWTDMKLESEVFASSLFKWLEEAVNSEDEDW